MDGLQVKAWESRCIEEAPPACSAACPLHVDARGMAESLAKGNLKAAHALFCRFIPFPEIIGRICDHPCEEACRRREAGDPIRIHALEKAVVEAGHSAPRLRTGRATHKRVAVVGAGLSGLSAAADLTVKGHTVVVFEAGAAPFARLRAHYAKTLPDAAIAADLARFAETAVDFRYHQTPDVDALAEEFDAVYLGCGDTPRAGADQYATGGDGRRTIDPLTYATGHPRIFAGGSLRYGARYSPIASLADGRHASLSIDRLLQGASLTANRDGQGSQTSRLYVNVARHAALPAIVAADTARGYTGDEAIAEAQRCFPCHCLECVRACPYLEHYGAYPKRYIREIYNNETIVMGARKSNRMIDSCTLCGLCAEVCPENLAMGEVCLSARQGMTARGKMPPSHHDFALRDLAYSRSDAFTLARHQPGHTRSAALFYPGCQLAASMPGQVERVYAHLCASIKGGVGLLLGCCGAPAQWAGRQDLQAQVDDEFAAQWRQLGRPRLITACSSCYRMFADRHPEVELQSLWSLLSADHLPAGGAAPRRTLAIHDPCTTRHETAMHADVRRIAARCGIDTAEIDGAERTSCCGYGGLAAFVNPALADRIVDRRIAQDDADYLTYCAMCRDNFARRGKRALHLLDLVFPGDGDAAARPDPGFSQRQENRGRLKRRLLRRLWNETVNEKSSANEIELSISAEVRADLERKLIIDDDLRQAIAHAEASGEKLIDPGSGHFIASHRLVAITYWVEYAPCPPSASAEHGAYVVYRAYSHRMQLESPS